MGSLDTMGGNDGAEGLTSTNNSTTIVGVLVLGTDYQSDSCAEGLTCTNNCLCASISHYLVCWC